MGLTVTVGDYGLAAKNPSQMAGFIFGSATCPVRPVGQHCEIADLFPAPIEIRPHIRAALAASMADQPRLNIGQPKIIRPRVAADGDRVAAAVVGAIDQDVAHAVGGASGPS